MHEENHPTFVKRTGLTARRLALLASVAAIGITVLAAGPGGWHPANLSVSTTSAQAAETNPPAPGFADIVAKVKPAVIGIHVKIEKTASANELNDNGTMPQFEPGSPMDKFLRQFGFPDLPNAAPRGRQTISGEGSGFFISADGYAVTNYHVVDHATTVGVTTDDGKTYTAKVVGTDQKTDLTLIKVEGSNFPYVQFAEHEPRVGDWVIAVGNPFGLGGTVTAGIISARGRDIGAGPYDDYIQIDAPINKGNSGGPAFDIEGKVIGINTAIYSPSGGSVGIGFDIPAETGKLVIAQLKEKGSVTRGWLGVQVQSVTPDIANSLNMKTAQGAIVDEPQEASPAAKAGIEAGDVITAINGTPVKDARDVARKIAAIAPGTAVKLAILHKGAEKTVSVNIGQLTNEQQAKAGSEPEGSGTATESGLGLTLAPASDVPGYGARGVVITAIGPDSAAANSGLQAGDVILDVAGKAVSNPVEVRTELGALRKEGKQAVLMRVKSHNGTRFVALPMGRA